MAMQSFQSNSSNKHPITSQDVVDFYTKLDSLNIKIWIDGGFCVDALLGRELRPHKDLDIAIQWKDVPELRKILTAQGYEQIKEDSQWNFVLADGNGRKIDLHAFIYDNKGNVADGIMYPAQSLNGVGNINGYSVRCISPEYMIKFLSPFINKYPKKYPQAIFELCKKFTLKLP